ncbi:hypothetical protein GGR51DRAFT_542140 [Nemania sp. FL0031]|nr:hypothetical protein GGR51DRAFT_542140 [Nemania sp. FL0031]
MASPEQNKKPDTKSYRGTWKKAKEDAFSDKHALKIPASEVAVDMIEALRPVSAVTDDNTTRRNKVIGDITKFLYNDNDDIDSCVRWAILHRAALDDDSVRNENSPQALLVSTIVSRERFLAFEFLNSPGSALRAQCRSRREDPKKSSLVPDHSKFGKDLKESPFYWAVESSQNKAVVKSMINNLELYCKEQVEVEPGKQRALLPNITFSLDTKPEDKARRLLLDVLQRPFQFGRNKRTALGLASEGKNKSRDLGVLKVLLEYSGITDTPHGNPPDATFENAMEDGELNVVKAFLEVQELRDKYVTSENIIKAMNHIGKAISNNGERSNNSPDIGGLFGVLQELLKHSNSAFNDQVAQKIIELNLEEAWDSRPTNTNLDETCLLHIAVHHQRVEFVERFLKDYPASVSTKALVPGTKMQQKSNSATVEEDLSPQGYYPLWYNHKQWSDQEKEWKNRNPNKRIRDLLAPATIRQVEKMQLLSSIFRESEEEVDELCFEMSQLNSKLYRVSDFVHSLISHQENAGLLLYESTIKYARFPPLDVHIDDKETFGRSFREEHTEVFDILDWLKEKKKVISIVELKVPDRLFNPHNELLIAECVGDFGVEILDWRFLDMSLSVFPADTVRPRIRELHLYSSGKRAAISHWFSEEGLITFPNLRNLEIHVIQDLISKDHCDETLEHIDSNLRDFEVRWANMKAQVEKEAREPRSMKEGEEGRESEQRIQTREEKKKEQKAIYKKFKGSIKTGVSSHLWNPTHERLTNLDELAQRTFPKISHFIKSYRNYVENIDKMSAIQDLTKYPKKRNFRPTKVAIIDNGILSISPVSVEAPLASRALRRFNKNSNTKKNIFNSTNSNVSNPKEQETKLTKATTSLPSSSLANNTAIPSHQTSGTKLAKTGLIRNTVGGDGWIHEARAAAINGTSTANTAATTGGAIEDEDRRITKGSNRTKGPGTLWSRIKEGKSFVDDDHHVSPWLFASDPHGTQMANLICAIDPACELYVAKVTDGNNFGISPERVIRAIEWAIAKGVDIISMSFAMFEQKDRLDEVIKEAKKQGIVMMCSNHDEGANTKESYPANCEHTWVVTACDEYGFTPRERDQSTDPGNYMFQGLDVAAGVIPFLESSDRISGSSVATAIASGIGSLILSCARLNTCSPEGKWHGESCHGPCAGSYKHCVARDSHDKHCRELPLGSCAAQTEHCDGANRRHIVSSFLEKMMPDKTKNPGYVVLDKFGEIDEEVKKGENVSVEYILQNWFSTGNLMDITREASKKK